MKRNADAIWILICCFYIAVIFLVIFVILDLIMRGTL